jgi:hypothetical protein
LEAIAPVINSVIRTAAAATAIPTRNILVKRETLFPAEDEVMRLLRLGLGTCKMNPIRYD